MVNKHDEQQQQQMKMRLKMVLPGDSGPALQESKTLFGLNQIKSSADLDRLVADHEADQLAQEPTGDEEAARRPKALSYDKGTGLLDSSGKFYRGEGDSEEELEFNSDDEYESDVEQNSLGN